MDPQQRLLLEVVYEALENGGVALERIAGTSTGVYVGASQIDYQNLMYKDVEHLPVYQSTGTSANILSNRISYALFGSEGKSFTFDSRAAGYGRGEGVVGVLLKPLDAAIHDSDNIRAVIRNTGVNQDGRTNGITYPSCEAQAKLMDETYQAAGLKPIETSYVEAHGTGTAAGDPVEAEAISKVFGNGRSIDEPLVIGSVKTNIGHLEAASGLTAMVKVIFALENGTNVHVILEQHTLKNNFTHINGIDSCHINLPYPGDDSKLTSESDEDPGKSRRRLFVFSARDKTSLKRSLEDIALYLAQAKPNYREAALMERLAFTLSQRRSILDWREAVVAATPSELSALLSCNSAEPIKPSGKPSLGFVFTGQGAQWHAMGRELNSYPTFAQSMYMSDMYLKEFGATWSLLDELQKDSESSFVNRPYISQPATTAVQIALVSLLSSWAIQPTTVVGHSSGEIAAAYAAGALSARSCLLVAFQRGALAERLLANKSERPGGMLAVGASPAQVRPMIDRLGSAQVVIACVNAPSIITASGDERGISRLQTITEQESLLNRRLKVDVAYHSPHMNEISTEYFDSIKAIEPRQVRGARFYSSVRGHLVETNSLDAGYWVENMTSPVQFMDAVQSMYSEGESRGPDVLVEIGPHSTLESSIRDILKSVPQEVSRVQYLPSLVRGQDADFTMLSLASKLFMMGCRLNFDAINHFDLLLPRFLTDLPAYPWNHSKRHWHESRLSINHRCKRFPRSDILGSLVDDFNDIEPRWRNILRVSDVPWLSDHRVQGSIVFPLTGYLAMAIEGAYQHAVLHKGSITAASQYKLQDVRIDRSMMLSDDIATEVSLVMRPQSVSSIWNCFRVFSWTSEGGWVEHCHGLITVIQGDREPNPISGVRQLEEEANFYKDAVQNCKRVCQRVLAPNDIYSRFSRGGLEFGPAFRNISAAHAADGYSTGAINIPDTAGMMPDHFESIHIIHPGTFDACFQIVDYAAGAGDLSRDDIHVPTFVKEITVCHNLPNSPGHRLDGYARASPTSSTSDPDIHASFFIMDSESAVEPLIKVEGLVVTRLPNQNIDVTKSNDRGLCYKLSWEPYLSLLKTEDFHNIFGSALDCRAPIAELQNHERAAFILIKSTLENVTAEEAEMLSPHHQKLYRTLSTLMGESNQKNLVFRNAQWVESGEAENNEFLRDLESSGACGRLVCSMGRDLSSVLKGEVEPLSMMVQDNMLKSYYREHNWGMWFYACTTSIADKLACENPNMRIVELGAGTGGATMPILHTLGQRFAYFDFTDVSAGFFESARAEQMEWADRISYRKLDIEEDPLDQGFQRESYDLVVAANVLHATANMANTIRNVRRLLKPGGKIIIAEITAQLLTNLMIFGTLPGWWLGEEPERRDKPFLNEQQWNDVLGANGFSRVDGSMQINGDGHSLGSVMLATAKPDQTAASPVLSLVQPQMRELKAPSEILSRLISARAAQPISVEHLLKTNLDDKYAIVVAMEDSFWLDIDESGLQKMKSTFQSARGILWVVRGASSQYPIANMVAGVARSIRSENAGLQFSTIDFDAETLLSDQETAEIILKVADYVFDPERLSPVVDMEFREIDGMLHIPRMLEDQSKDDYIVRETRPSVPEPEHLIQERPLKMKIGQIGLLDSIYFETNLAEQLPLSNDEIEISVKATGMNFKDVMISLGQIPYYHDPGLECSGVVTAIGSEVSEIKVGDSVCGMAEGAYGSSVRVKSSKVVRMPHDMTFSEAASIPIVFCTALYALVKMGNICEGESILIHAAAGGVGQAAIMLAQNAKAEIYATVSSIEKRNLLMEMYAIPQDHIFSSRDTAFSKELMSRTSQRGVDIILNSTTGDILQSSWQCLAPFGRFFELGKWDIVQNSKIGMEKFADAVSFIGVDLGALLKFKPQIVGRMLRDVMELHRNKTIRPITPIRTIPMSQISQGMRMMQTGKHLGKLVVEVTSEDIVPALPVPPPNTNISADASYLITGGTGGLGRSISRWLVGQGAKNIVLASRSGMNQRGITELIDEAKAFDANVVVKACDIADNCQVQRLVEECQLNLPPIRGVIHGAMALRDALFDTISYEDWTLNIMPRVNGAWNLHNNLSASPLDFFVILASLSGFLGNPGQTAYAASNCFLDSFAAYRQRLGLAACAIDIGVVESVGYVAENVDRRAEISKVTHDSLSERELHALVKAAIMNPHCQDYRQTITGLKLLPDRPLPVWFDDPKFAHVLHKIQSLSASSSTSTEGAIPVRQLLKAASSVASATGIIVEALIDKLASLLMLSKEDIESSKPVVAYGLDSLVAVEFRNWIARDLDARVPLMVIMNSASIEHLGGKIAAEFNPVGKELIREGKD
ncbi:MAG: hypothetical protein Q9191_000596 [Dirinaria sp. TL-2023a]